MGLWQCFLTETRITVQLKKIFKMNADTLLLSLSFLFSIIPAAACETLGAFVVTPGVKQGKGFLTETWITF